MQNKYSMKGAGMSKQEMEMLCAFRKIPFNARVMHLKLTQRAAERYQEELDRALRQIAEPESSDECA
jgi:hypothetical protein